MKRSKKSKSNEPSVAHAVAAAPQSVWANGNDKQLNNFLYPPMLGSFDPWAIKKLSVEKRRDRYIQVFNATMGNHSVSMYYACWDQDSFDSALNDNFQKRIDQARSQLADRAAYIMHKTLGLVASDEPIAPPTVSAAMAKVVESFGEPSAAKGGLKKAYKLTVNGLQMPAPTGAVAVKRGPGRPPKQAAPE